MLFGPSSVALLICLMALLISPVVRVSCVERSVYTTSVSSVFSSTGLFKSSSKCSTHLFCRPWASVIDLPSLFLAGRSGLRYFYSDFLVVSYSSPIFPFLEALSAVIARYSSYFRLSALMLFATRFLLVYTLDFAALFRLLATVFSFFLSLVLNRISIATHPGVSCSPAFSSLLKLLLFFPVLYRGSSFK